MPIKRQTTPHAGAPRRRARGKPDPAAFPAFPTLVPFAERLENLRLERGLTQRTLAARARISVHYYQDIAHARANPTVIALLNLAQALDVSLADLFESPAPRDERRAVLVTDLVELTATHERLTLIVERLAKDHMRRRKGDEKRPEHA